MHYCLSGDCFWRAYCWICVLKLVFDATRPLCGGCWLAFQDDWLVSISCIGKLLEDKIPDQPMKASPPIKTLKAPPTLKTVTERVVVREPRKNPNTTIAATSYSVADLQAATNSFAQESLVGEGSLGRVYRGDFQDGQVCSYLFRSAVSVEVQICNLWIAQCG